MRTFIIATALAVFLFSSMTWAAEPASIDFSQPIIDQDGKVLQAPADANGKSPGVFTLGVAAAQALFGVYQDETTISGQKKFERGVLAMKVKDGGHVTLSPEDLATIKELIGKAYTPLVVTRAWPLLDPTKVTK